MDKNRTEPLPFHATAQDIAWFSPHTVLAPDFINPKSKLQS
jgi:hypothetical protein